MRKKIFTVVFITSFLLVFSTLGLFFSWRLSAEKAIPIFILSIWGVLNSLIIFIFFYFRFYNLLFINKTVKWEEIQKRKNFIFILLISLFLNLLLFISASILYITLPIVYTGNQINNIEYAISILISIFVIFFQFTITKKLLKNYLVNSKKAFRNEKTNY